MSEDKNFNINFPKHDVEISVDNLRYKGINCYCKCKERMTPLIEYKKYETSSGNFELKPILIWICTKCHEKLEL
jgi:hypothetical protein